MAKEPKGYHYRCDVRHCRCQGFTVDAQDREYSKLDHELDSGHDKWTTKDAPMSWMSKNRNRT